MSTKSVFIAVVIAIVVALGAGIGGYVYGQQAGRNQAQAIRTRFFQDRGAGGSGGQGAGTGQGAGGQGRNAANFATGQVKTINGNTIELSTATAVVKVNISNQTQFQKMDSGSLSDIQPGERLIIQGSQASDGTFTARSIQIGRAGGGPGGNAGGGPGNAAQQPPQGPATAPQTQQSSQ